MPGNMSHTGCYHIMCKDTKILILLFSNNYYFLIFLLSSSHCLLFLLCRMPFLSPSWMFFFYFRLPVILFFSFTHPLLSCLSSCSLHLSPGSASGLSQQPFHHPMWGEQRGGDWSLPQHQEGSLSWDLQLARVRAPSGRWGDLLHLK